MNARLVRHEKITDETYHFTTLRKLTEDFVADIERFKRSIP
jgi:hypothetical protein